MTVAAARNSAGLPFVVPNTCKNSAGSSFTLDNSARNSAGTQFLIFAVTLATVPVDETFIATTNRVFLAT
jgi:hypothetical protein